MDQAGGRRAGGAVGDPDRAPPAARPVWRLPGAIQWPSLAAWKLTVTSASTAAPGDLAGRGVDARGDVGGDHRGAGQSLIALDRRRRRARAARRRSRCRRSRRPPRPSPRARPRRRRAPSSRTPPSRRSRFARASSESSSARPQQQHLDLGAGRGQMASGDQPVAAVVPLAADDPRRAGRRRPRAPPRRPPRPAASISSSDGTPRSSIAHESTARIVSASRSGSSQLSTAPA